MRFEAIGVPWSIETPEPLDAEVRRAIHERIEAYDRNWSRFRADSVVSRMARGEAVEPPAAERDPLFALYDLLAATTGGRMSLHVGAALSRLGYGGAAIDVGAAGKGQLVDLVAGVLEAHGVDAWTVDASGDIRHRGRAIRIALEHPWDATMAIGVVELADGAICASATNRRRWVDLSGRPVHHVVDGLTGVPVGDVVATWALAADAMTADGASTALFFTADLPSALGVEWARITSAGRVEVSPGFPGEVFG